MKIINMTPHGITILNDKGMSIRDIPASGQMIRLDAKTVSVGSLTETLSSIDDESIAETSVDIPLTKTTYGETNCLPKYQNGTYYIVSQLVKSAFPKRMDFLVPAQVVRDEKGNIIGCLSLGI